MPGTTTSKIEVTNIDSQGLWLFVEQEEYFLPHDDYPWFKDARLSDVLNVELLPGQHIHWPALDVDLSVEILKNPESFPLKSK
ncbi:MAG: DUF2442 domain-containing protein [Verrucomicrobia bacterium]|nr:DUF2442 domain-containing protein [Verrucomicrobiota bacterium]